MNRTLTFVTIPAIALVIGGGVQIARPLPPVQVHATQTQVKLPGNFAVTFPNQGQAAVGEESLGIVSETPNEHPVAIASLTKMMTAYLLLQAKPLQVGVDGPVTTITAADVQEYEKDKGLGYSVAKVSVGDKLTERQMLEALLLPSADNIATLIATQVAGSEANFVVKMNQAAKALGMTQTNYADAAGVNPATVSTAHDQILIAQAVMQDRIFREVVREPQAVLPTAGKVFNVNFMVGKQGISGIKTGSTLAAGSCFVGSYPVTVDGAEHIMLAAVLGQPSLRVAITTNAQMLHAVTPQFKTYQVPLSDDVAELTTSWKEQSTLKASKLVQVFGAPGMTINLAAKLKPTTLPIEAGTEVAELAVGNGPSAQKVGLVADQAIQKPGLVWKLFH